MAKKQKTYWQQLGERLETRRWTQSMVRLWLSQRKAPVVVGQATLSDLFRGVTKNPNFELGDALRELDRSGEEAPTAKAE